MRRVEMMEKQVPRGLKPARNDKIEGDVCGTAEAVPLIQGSGG